MPTALELLHQVPSKTGSSNDLPGSSAEAFRSRINLIDRKNVVSAGNSGLIQRLPCGNVRKCVYSELDYDICLRDLEPEFRIYQKLPRHDRLLRLVRYSPEEGLVLQYMPRGSLRKHLREAATTITLPERLQWACDAAESLHLLHSHGIIHCDLKPENFLLDSSSRLKIIDFSGSSFDGLVGSAIKSTRTDLFALGSTIYEIMTGRQPYEELSDEEVEARYSRKIFPSVQGVPCGRVIMDYWRCEIQTAEEAMKLLKAEMEHAHEH
ncbi:kinase-like domain-containing protein [Achaetomium macrosporum]|uniref:Kinase-like domain-containing protein n=1 Tax=Achaetomium macrosporum TaxID=79813 RepID=A0AAN7C4G5_9PEZI|nr:kinase-like domain-containing protein [Achaetomium macrosporum]